MGVPSSDMEELARLTREIADYARSYGLDFYKTIFEMLDPEELNQVASYGGFPSRIPHWTFGMEYEQLSKSYTYGLSKIYELVINNDPCYAYLMRTNAMIDQKLVIAHVYAHCDFFKHNIWFSKTNRKMVDEMANHAARVRRYIDRHGFEDTETFIDVCFSINNLIDPHAPFTDSKPDINSLRKSDSDSMPAKLKSKAYMDKYINPKEYLEEQKEKLAQEIEEKRNQFPAEPTKDILAFLLSYAPLEKWQRDILSMIREEAYYFCPQGQTKIMNEGWATYWHSKIMTEKVLSDSELIDYADHHSGTLAMAPGSLNPYKIGVELFRDIEDRWNKGRFGKEYEECDSMREKLTWNRETGLGRQKIFEVRKIYNDLTFIDEFLTPEFCREHKLFSYAYNYKSGQFEIADRAFEAIKKKLLFSLTNFGQPIMFVTDGNYKNRGELLLTHSHEGIDLRIDWAKEVIKNIFHIWQRPVNLQTVVEGRRKVLSFDGKEHQEKEVATKATQA